MATVRQNRTHDALENVRAAETTRDLLAALGAPFMSGVQVSFDAPAAASVRVAHRLGRKPVGWLMLDATAGVPQLYRESWDDAAIIFNSGAVSTVTLWVF